MHLDVGHDRECEGSNEGIVAAMDYSMKVSALLGQVLRLRLRFAAGLGVMRQLGHRNGLDPALGHAGAILR
jgi:hypothetical protein